jgi:alanine racemase
MRDVMRHRPTVAVVDLDAIRHNVLSLKPQPAAVMAVVKADGYGHGAVPVARVATEAGAGWLGVAMVEEGIALRESGLVAPILVLSECPPGAEKEALAARLTPTAYTDEGLARLGSAAGSVGGTVGVHVKIDTGMHRAGLMPERALEYVRALRGHGLSLEGLWTHLAAAEDLADGTTDLQLQRFSRVIGELSEAGLRPRYVHAANSAAIMARPAAHFDMVRLGLAMYGLCPGPDLAGMVDLRPAMSWRSAVSLARRVARGEGISYGLRYRLDRETTIATVPVGYADGYSRLLSGKAEVLIRGRRHPVAGAVTMDHIMVDCRDHPVESGDEVVLMGDQGDARITADDLASWMGTINYEVVCAISARVPREYVEEP